MYLGKIKKTETIAILTMKNNIKKLIAEKRAIYDHHVDQKGYKWSGKSRLKKVDNDFLPNYIASNLEKYKNWLD